MIEIRVHIYQIDSKQYHYFKLRKIDPIYLHKKGILQRVVTLKVNFGPIYLHKKGILQRGVTL